MTKPDRRELLKEFAPVVGPCQEYEVTTVCLVVVEQGTQFPRVSPKLVLSARPRVALDLDPDQASST